MNNETESIVEQVRARLALPEPSRRRMIRKRAGVTLTSIAEALGCTRAAVRLWERGERTPQGELLTGYLEVLAALEAELNAADDEDRDAS